MFFRNLTLFRFPAAAGDNFLRSLWQGLADCALKHVGPSELMSVGFVSPYGVGEDALHIRCGMAYLVTVGSETRLLPAAIINAELGKRVAAVEEREGRRLGGRARKRLKEDLVMELLPQALVRPSRINAYLDLKRGFLAVDTSSRRAAEHVASEIRHALGSFPALPVNAESSPRAVLTGWLAGDALPAPLSLGDGCLLKDPVDGGATARLQHQELGADEIRKHLESGKQCARLALVYDNHISFELGEDLVLRKLRFLDAALDTLEDVEREGLQAEVNARFALMEGNIGLLFDVLEKALQISKAEG